MSTKIDNLKKVISQYIALNNEIKEMDKKTKLKRDQKNSLEKYLIDTFKFNNLHNKEIAVTNNQSLKFVENDKKEALSQKYIKKTLQYFFVTNYSHTLKKARCVEKSNEIFDFLLKNREEKKNYNIKIIKNK